MKSMTRIERGGMQIFFQDCIAPQDSIMVYRDIETITSDPKEDHFAVCLEQDDSYCIVYLSQEQLRNFRDWISTQLGEVE